MTVSPSFTSHYLICAGREIHYTQWGAEHEQLGIPPLEVSVTHPGAPPFRRDLLLLIGLPLLALLAWSAGHWLLPAGWQPVADQVALSLGREAFWLAVAVGLFAQIIDGALGMAYGITATTFLLSTGVPPAAGSSRSSAPTSRPRGCGASSRWRSWPSAPSRPALPCSASKRATPA